MQTVYEALGGALGVRVGRPTGSRVHRDTRTLPGQEGAFWRPFSRRNAARYLHAAERYDRLQRLRHRNDRNGRKNGTLGHIGLEVLRELLRLIDYKTGRLDPAIVTIAGRVGRSVAAVAEALKRLRAHGFLSWLRRYVPTGKQGIRGPQVRQTSNAYALAIPKAVMIDSDPPLPDDEAERVIATEAQHEAMIASLPLFERNRALFNTRDGEAIADSISRMMQLATAREVQA